eukprot:TRINITY_DN6523_c0_g1_i2.p1 TRINITY_DN6523_c0_g1~~TRINITY_DN6523_c0_g1_i2.p1  ORF type:complete len:396 (+),score=111.45 TRINITY_DN6523_c0_g1_i2:57-1244(+)
MSKLTLKFKFGDDIRRISIDESEFSMEIINGYLKRFFNNKCENFIIQYIDSDNDLITVDSDIDLDEAYNHKKHSVVTFYIKDRNNDNCENTQDNVHNILGQFNDSMASLESSSTLENIYKDLESNSEVISQILQILFTTNKNNEIVPEIQKAFKEVSFVKQNNKSEGNEEENKLEEEENVEGNIEDNNNNNNDNEQEMPEQQQESSKNDYRASFLKNITLDDSSVVKPNTDIFKTWRIKNTGEVPWPKNTALIFTGGDQMSLQSEYPLGNEVPRNGIVELKLPISTPSLPGNYKSYYRFKSGNDLFGNFWINITVAEEEKNEENAVNEEKQIDKKQEEINNNQENLADLLKDIPLQYHDSILTIIDMGFDAMKVIKLSFEHNGNKQAMLNNLLDL